MKATDLAMKYECWTHCFSIQWYKWPLMVLTMICIVHPSCCNFNVKNVYTHDPQMRWRACGNGWVCCSRRPTCARHPRQYPASHHWPPCCRTLLSGSQWRCCHHTRPQSSSCTHLSAPSGTRGSEGISAGKEQPLNASARLCKMLTRTGQERIQQFAKTEFRAEWNGADGVNWSDLWGLITKNNKKSSWLCILKDTGIKYSQKRCSSQL